MKLLTGIAIGLSTTAKYVTKGVKGTYNYVKEDVTSVPDGIKLGWKDDYTTKLAEVVEKHKDK